MALRTSSFAWLYILNLVCACAPKAELLRDTHHPSMRTAIAITELPIKKVRFFESGLAEYEHQGPLTDGVVALRMPRSHLDDALQTLVVRREHAQMPVFSLNFDSVVVPAAAQSQAHLLGESPQGQAYLGLLLSLKGEQVEIVTDQTQKMGRLVDVVPLEAKPEARTAEDPPHKVESRGKATRAQSEQPANEASELHEYELTLLTDSGDILRIHSRKVRRIRPLDQKLSARIQRAVGARSRSAEQVSEEIRIAVEPGGPVSLSYVTEAPLYRTNYRLTMQESEKPATFQGWALVHNDTDEPWNSVSIELSNGEPDSSVVPLAAPRYSERPIKNLTSAQTNLLPQLFGSSADSLSAGTTVTNKSTSDRDTSLVKRAPKLPPKGMMSSSPPTPTSSPNAIAIGRSSYVYNIMRPVTMGAHSSALLPFLDIPLRAERGVWFAVNATSGRSIIRLENGTATPIPAGLLTVIEAGHYSGMAEIPELEPGHWGFFDFGTELGLEVKYTVKESKPARVQTIAWKDDTLRVTVKEHTEQSISLSNTSSEHLVAYLAVSALDGASIKGADRVETTGAARPIAVAIQVPAHSQLERNLTTDQSRLQELDVESLDLDFVVDMGKTASLPATVRKVLQTAVVELKSRQLLQTRKEQIEQEIARIDAAVERLPSSDPEHGLASLLAARLLQLESQRLTLQRTNDQLDKEIESKVSLLKKILTALPPQ